MPLYDYECPNGHIHEQFLPFDQRESRCLKCGSISQRIVTFNLKARTVDVFQPYREESLGDDYPEVRSKAHLAEMCRERGLCSKMLMDGYRNHGSRREI